MLMQLRCKLVCYAQVRQPEVAGYWTNYPLFRYNKLICKE